MIYTIGHKQSYDGNLARDGILKKLGAYNMQYPDYKGGSVWKKKSEADSFLSGNQPRLAEYAVYGVLADWNKCTRQIEGEPFRRLLVTSEIIALE